MITADFALSQGREVFALPGHVTSRNSATPNRLLKSGAVLVENAEDILAEFGICTKPKKSGRETARIPESVKQSLSKEETAIIKTIEVLPKRLDNIIYETDLQCERVSSILLLLEIKGLVAKTIDGSYCVADGSIKF